jgi:N-acetylglucosamine-6-sulfatase
VDDAVRRIVATLEAKSELNSTYFLFTSDNGYHMGERRMGPGKMTPYLTDVAVPLIVRGPSVPAGETRGELLQNVDLAPTFAELADLPVPNYADGTSFAPFLRGESVVPSDREAALIEGMGRHPFRGLISDGYSYTEYRGGFRELYDLSQDPHQLDNLLHEPTPEEEAEALSARLKSLKDCTRETCSEAEGS